MTRSMEGKALQCSGVGSNIGGPDIDVRMERACLRDSHSWTKAESQRRFVCGVNNISLSLPQRQNQRWNIR